MPQPLLSESFLKIWRAVHGMLVTNTGALLLPVGYWKYSLMVNSNFCETFVHRFLLTSVFSGSQLPARVGTDLMTLALQMASSERTLKLDTKWKNMAATAERKVNTNLLFKHGHAVLYKDVVHSVISNTNLL